MKEKWSKLETFHKSFITSMVLCTIMVMICAILILIDTSYIYGALLGSILLIVSHLIIWGLWYGIPSIKKWMAKSTPWLAPFIRILIYITALLLVIYFVNNNSNGMDIFLYPINTIVLLITYTITPFSYVAVIVIDIILNKKGGEQ